MNTWKVIGDLGFLLLAVGLLVLGTGFLFFTRWRKTGTGRSIGTFFISTNAILTLAVLRLFKVIPAGDWLLPVRAIVFSVGGLAVLAISVAFVRLQFLRRGQKSEVRLD